MSFGFLPSGANWAFWEGGVCQTWVGSPHMVGRGSPNCQSPKPTLLGVGHVLPTHALAMHSSLRSRQCEAPTTFLSLEREIIDCLNGRGRGSLFGRMSASSDLQGVLVREWAMAQKLCHQSSSGL